MKFKSIVFAQASGSIAGMTYSRNKGGMYVRSRSLVITPSTPQQVDAQNAMKTLSRRWSTLTAVQRDAWKDYAINTPLLDRLGESRTIPELAMYVRCNSPRLQAIGSSAIVDDAPTIFGMAVLTPPTLTATAPDGLSIGYDNTDEWAITTGGYLIVQVSRPISPTVVFPKAHYRITGDEVGDTTTPPTSPFAATSVFAFAADQQILARVTASNSDGRLSSAQVISTVAL